MNRLYLLIFLLMPAGAFAEVHFETEIAPLFTKAGCNSGSCHGGAAGRGGFKLALLGGDPSLDYEAIVHQLQGRRINVAHPERSLIVTKPTEQLDHGGGTRLEFEGPDHRLFLKWIAQGAPRGKPRSILNFEVTPASTVLKKIGETVQLKAEVTFADSTQPLDVTERTTFASSDDSALSVTSEGKITVRRRGQNILIARFLDQVVAVRFTIPLNDTPVEIPTATADSAGRSNFVDEEILATLRTLHLPLSSSIEDEAFLRRVRLDLTGTLPAPGELREFRKQTPTNKRAEVVDRLFQTDEFVDFWTLKFANLLRITSKTMKPEGATAFHGWVHRQIAEDRPYDKMAREMITGLGDSYQLGPPNFSRATGNARMQAEYASQVLMGVRLRCANCHNHPLDRWTQDDYHGFSAIFARLERGQQVRLAERGDVTHPRTGQPAVPRIPGTRFLKPEKDGRVAFAEWLTGKENPYFAKAIVNRLWKEMFGRGLVEPVDDLRATNPATHPELLERLAKHFRDHQYRLRPTLKLIATSAAYARSSQSVPGNQGDDRYYSHFPTRPLPAEVLADAIDEVTGIPTQYGKHSLGQRAIALIDSEVPSEALDLLGRCARDGTCESSPASSGGLATKLHLLNGALLNAKITDRGGFLHQSLKSGKSDAAILNTFYLKAFSRVPNPQEREHWNREFQRAKAPSARQQLWEDILWAMLSSREFTTNH